ncbi:nucleotide exchange factor GrpE [Pseudoflavonifractor sp. An44]|uniref:nucleotide exchange factor GrpE n=1 Tax=Pseudoflavonifractor sp. An44 TaxID=1965635 RepID=UPI000B39DA13|nr:nucleotide exchange factor GrpE [Pseudoflavonifractor sp. An44]OUN99216.1 nucleotide exchange factor GrpE [Pseudoflavonifractor sp. An44]
MDEKNVNKENLEPQVEKEELVEEPQPDTQPEAPKADQPETGAPKADDQLAQAQEKYLRLAAEYDNYRKRTAKEKESAWTNAKAQTVAAFLPVYDNLERALKQQTTDEAYAKGVEMTMKGLQDALSGLGVELIPALGETFDPNRHNAVMHVEDDAAEENTVVEVFQQGFTCGDKVIRFAMVKVAN